MYKKGDLVKWRSPLDADYSYGFFVESNKRNIATVIGCGYYTGFKFGVHLRYIEKVKKGGNGFGGSEEYSK